MYSDKLCKMIDEVRSGNGVSECQWMLIGQC